MRSSAAAIASGSAPLRTRGRGDTGRYSKLPTSICATSTGTPSATGPGRPVRICMKARRSVSATLDGSSIIADHLLTGLKISRNGISLVNLLATLVRSLCPARNSTGTESPQELTMPPIRFAAAGPASVNTTAGLPLARAKPSQMSNATRSCRAYISDTSSQSPMASMTGQIDWPAMPAASVTPSETSARLMA